MKGSQFFGHGNQHKASSPAKGQFGDILKAGMAAGKKEEERKEEKEEGKSPDKFLGKLLGGLFGGKKKKEEESPTKWVQAVAALAPIAQDMMKQQQEQMAKEQKKSPNKQIKSVEERKAEIAAAKSATTSKESKAPTKLKIPGLKRGLKKIFK